MLRLTLRLIITGAIALSATFASAQDEPAPPVDTLLNKSVDQLRHVIGTWDVITETLNEKGKVTQTDTGLYHFEWAVEDRVIIGKNSLPSRNQQSGILFFINERDGTIEMLSVAADGYLWHMTGPLGDETRYSQEFETQSGGMAQLRFTRSNVTEDRFESEMEYTEDNGETWIRSNHQIFTRSKK